MGKKRKRDKRRAKASARSLVAQADDAQLVAAGSSRKPRPVRRRFTASQAYPWREIPVGADQSGDQAVANAFQGLMAWGRHLDQNVGIAGAVLDELVNRTVGAGIIVAPDPRTDRGAPLEDLAAELLELHEEHSERYDVTGELDRSGYERLEARAFFRDGACFTQHVAGRGRSYPFGPSDVPYRVELLENEMVPFDFDDERRGYRMGVQLDTWRRPIAYAVYRGQPNDYLVGSRPVTHRDVKRVKAENLSHLKLVKRWPQTRGVSTFAAAMASIFDLDDYKQSELIAARLGASLTGYIQRDPAAFDPPEEEIAAAGRQRELEMDAGQIIDDLLPGESVGTIKTDRPNNALIEFRREIIRDIAAATGTRYSTIARDFSGTYSSQRQELVEAGPMYDALRQALIRQGTRARYRRWLVTAVLDGRVRVPRGTSLRSLWRARYVGPRLPWIDPVKEAQAAQLEIELGLTTAEELRERRGVVSTQESEAS